MTPNLRSAGGPRTSEDDTNLTNPQVAGRRPALPNGRAVVGGLLVAAAAVGTYGAWAGADDPPSARYVVTTRDLTVGEVVDPTDVELVAIDVPDGLAERAFDASELVVGQRTVAPLAAGELVQRSAVVAPDGASAAGGGAAPGRQLSFAIDEADALAGTLEVGEPVDVLVTYGGTSADSVTEVVATGAVVAGLPGGDDDLGSGSGGQLVVLLSLAEGTDVLAVTNAVRQGSVTLVRSFGDPVAPGERYSPDLGAGS